MNNDRKKSLYDKFLGLKNLRVTEEMHEEIIKTSKEDSRTLQDQVRWLLSIGLEQRKLILKK
ncbi:MAG: hypothetical protein PHF86_02900 [Candidatus Nanoarchaeia archaeon]|jgi:hypothetical protein|nr:hypothetical protein [Candidatus Nanoarchaeia archaeon]